MVYLQKEIKVLQNENLTAHNRVLIIRKKVEELEEKLGSEEFSPMLKF